MVIKNFLYLWLWCYNFLFDVSSMMKVCSICLILIKWVRGVVYWIDGGYSIFDYGWWCVYVLLICGVVRRVIK